MFNAIDIINKAVSDKIKKSLETKSSGFIKNLHSYPEHEIDRKEFIDYMGTLVGDTIHISSILFFLKKDFKENHSEEIYNDETKKIIDKLIKEV